MKTEIYNALAALNGGFDTALESLTILQNEGVLSPEFVERQGYCAEELRAAINYMIVQKLASRETEDCDHYGKMRENIEAQVKAST